MKIKEIELMEEINDNQEEKKADHQIFKKILLGIFLGFLIVLAVILSSNILLPMGGYYLGGPTI